MEFYAETRQHRSLWSFSARCKEGWIRFATLVNGVNFRWNPFARFFNRFFKVFYICFKNLISKKSGVSLVRIGQRDERMFSISTGRIIYTKLYHGLIKHRIIIRYDTECLMDNPIRTRSPLFHKYPQARSWMIGDQSYKFGYYIKLTRKSNCKRRISIVPTSYANAIHPINLIHIYICTCTYHKPKGT